jgi:hypothetical protein
MLWLYMASEQDWSFCWFRLHLPSVSLRYLWWAWQLAPEISRELVKQLGMLRVWLRLFYESVLQSARSYFLWAGPFYGLFGLGLSLYFSSLGAGKALGPVLAGTLRLFIVAVGGALLALLQAPAWAIFALVGAGMAIYGLSTLLIVRSTDWG